MRNSLYLSLNDLFSLIKRYGKYVLVLAASVGFLLSVYKMQKPLGYTAEGVFRSSSVSPSPGLASSIQLLQNMKEDKFTSQEEPKGFLLSTPVLENVARKLNLQAHLDFPQPGGFFKRISRSFQAVRAKRRYLKIQRPSSNVLHSSVFVPDRLLFPDIHCPFVVTNISYKGETYLNYRVVVHEDRSFTLYHPNRTVEGHGTLGIPYKATWGELTLEANPQFEKQKKPFSLTLIPLSAVTDSLAKSYGIERDKEHASLYQITFSHQNRHFAADLVNALMEGYLEFLRQDAESQANSQILYLNQRRGQMHQDLKTMLAASFDKETNKKWVSRDQEGEFLTKSILKCQMDAFDIRSALLHHLEDDENALNELLSSSSTLPQSSLPFPQEVKPLSEILKEKEFEWHEKILLREEGRALLEHLSQPQIDPSLIALRCQDPYLEPIIKKLHDLHAALADLHNWASGEKQRMKEEIETLRNTLKVFLQQRLESVALEEQDLILQIKQLRQHLIYLLKIEFLSIQEKLFQLYQQAQTLPERWFSETLEEMEVGVHKEVLQAISKMIESKNIHSHIERIQAGPLQKAIAPNFPNSPRPLKAFTIGMGGILFMSSLAAILYLAFKGPTITSKALSSAGYEVLGTLSNDFHRLFSTQDRATLTRLLQKGIEKKFLVLISQKETLATQGLYTLLSESQQKGLLLSFPPFKTGIPSTNQREGKKLEWKMAHTLLQDAELWPLLLSTPQFLDKFERKEEEWLVFHICAAPTDPLLQKLSSQYACVFLPSEESFSELLSLPENMSLLLTSPAPQSFPTYSLENVKPLLDEWLKASPLAKLLSKSLSS